MKSYLISGILICLTFMGFSFPVSAKSVVVDVNVFKPPEKNCLELTQILKKQAVTDAIGKINGIESRQVVYTIDQVFLGSLTSMRTEGIARNLTILNGPVEKKPGICCLTAEVDVPPSKFMPEVKELKTLRFQVNSPQIEMEAGIAPLSQKELKQLQKGAERIGESLFMQNSYIIGKQSRRLIAFTPHIRIQRRLIGDTCFILALAGYDVTLSDTTLNQKIAGVTRLKTAYTSSGWNLPSETKTAVSEVYQKIMEDTYWQTRILTKLDELTGISSNERLLAIYISRTPTISILKKLSEKLVDIPGINNIKVSDTQFSNSGQSVIYVKTELPSTYVADIMRMRFSDEVKLIEYSNDQILLKYVSHSP